MHDVKWMLRPPPLAFGFNINKEEEAVLDQDKLRYDLIIKQDACQGKQNNQ